MNVDSYPVNVLSLCSGAGGLDLGVRMALPNARTVCAVEIEAYACEVLASRMEEGRLDSAPIWTDLRTFDGRPWRGVVDLVIGGYPCQPFSAAGKRLGTDDPRHLWPHVARILRECEAPACFFENVRGHVSLGLRDVQCELEEMGYRVDAEIVRAEEVGAPHRRERVFILAHTDGADLWLKPRRSGGENGAGAPEPRDDGEAVADAVNGERIAGTGDKPRRRLARSADNEGQRQYQGLEPDERGWTRSPGETVWPPGPNERTAWKNWIGPQPAIRRDADGLESRVDRLRICGNGVVPQQAAYAFDLLRRRVK